VINGEKLTTGQISIFILGAGGFQGKRTSQHVIPVIDPPSRNPDATITQQTSADQVRKIM
jgi:3-hydroxyacyl-CoA dehydrogenase/3a,7a,12a-trihydroxy-5b-cholest-24-enoyl-CoA hydratase